MCGWGYAAVRIFAVLRGILWGQRKRQQAKGSEFVMGLLDRGEWNLARASRPVASWHTAGSTGEQTRVMMIHDRSSSRYRFGSSTKDSGQ